MNLIQRYSVGMLKNGPVILCCFLMTTGVAQKIKNPCVYESLTQKEKREETLERHQPIYDFHKGDKLASVGAGGGSKEVIYSMMADSLVFYLQDVNPTCLTPEIVRATVSQLYNAAGRTCTATFTSVIRTEKETRLPNQFFDKIIIENTLHELTHPSDMVASIRANLKPNGYLYVEDFMAKRPGQKHRGCRKPLFTEEALVQLLDVNGFRLLTSTFVYPNNRVNKIYKFALETK